MMEKDKLKKKKRMNKRQKLMLCNRKKMKNKKTKMLPKKLNLFSLCGLDQEKVKRASNLTDYNLDL